MVARVAAGTGPIALDAERASGYRYSPRAYLIQLRREGSGTALIDPTAFDDLSSLTTRSATPSGSCTPPARTSRACARSAWCPRRLFDTELAARLLGYPRVGLATLVEVILGRSMRKEHSAVDWSRRPLPQPWLEYAALDVEVLLELREVIAAELVESGKDDWAAQEFEHLIDHVPPPRQDPWRRTSGIHKAKGRRALAAVRELWTTRDAIAEQRDTTPGRLIPDSAIIVAANAMPTTTSALLDTPGFHGRGARRYADRWLAALDRARDAARHRPAAPDDPLRRPAGAARVGRARPRRRRPAWPRLARLVTAFAEEHQVPVENLLTPDYLRRVLWKPPADDRPDLEAARRGGARPPRRPPWQIEIIAPMLAEAILHPKQPRSRRPDASLRPSPSGTRRRARARGSPSTG